MSVPGLTHTTDITTFIGAFIQSYEGTINGMWGTDLTNNFGIDSLTGTYPGLADATGMKLWSSTRQKNSPLPFKLSITSAIFESSVLYPVDNYKTDRTGVFKSNVENLAEKAAWHKTWLLRDLLPTLHAAPSFDSLYDGATVVNYFSTSHPIGFDATGANPTGTQSNLFTSHATPNGTTDLGCLAVVDKNNPTALEMATIMLQVAAQMLAFQNITGDQINGGMRSIYVIVGDPAKYASAVQACEQDDLISSIQGAVAQNPLAGLTDAGFKFRAILEPSLTGDSIYFARADGRVKPFVVQSTSGIEFQPLGPDSEFAKLNNQVMFGVKEVCQVAGLLYTSAAKATLITHT